MATRKDAATRFLQLAATGRAKEAFQTYAGAAFRHHNPHFAATADALSAAMDDNARQNPEKRLDVLRAIEDGDLVAVHSRVQHAPSDRGFAVVHIFRFDGDRVVELWDLAQEVPAESPNREGMF